jgi:predicted nucleic acid-binding protein
MRRVLSEPGTDIVIPAIVLAELKHLYFRNRVELSYEAVVAKLASDPRCTILPLDLRILDLLPRGLELHDAIICATAAFLAKTQSDPVKVATRDAEIIQSGLVETVW